MSLGPPDVVAGHAVRSHGIGGGHAKALRRRRGVHEGGDRVVLGPPRQLSHGPHCTGVHDALPASAVDSHVRVRGIDFVAYHVTDMEQAVAFYRDTLGIQAPFLVTAPTWTEFDTRPATLAIVKWDEHPGAGAVALSVDDVTESIDELRGKGVRVVLEPVETDECWLAIIADPAGNLIYIHHRKDGSAG
jgi:lactoylglutathione lyase